MATKRTHEQFLQELKIKNEAYRNGEFEVVGVVDKDKTKNALIKEKGIYHSISRNNLLKNRSRPSIKSAKNKTEYFISLIKDFYKGYNITGQYLTHDSFFELEKDGFLYNMPASALLRNTSPNELYVKDKHKYFLHILEKNRKDFKDIKFLDKLQYYGQKVNVEYKNCLHNITLSKLIKGTKFCIKNAVNKTDFIVSNIGVSIKNRTSYERFSFKDHKTKGVFICKKHNVEYKQKINHHINGHKGCPLCIEGISFYTNIAKVEDNPDFFEKIDAIFYIVKIENFYKVGYTKRSVEDRMNDIKKSYEIIYEKNTNLLEALQKENEILEAYKHYKFIPNDKFGGWTECLSINPYDDIMGHEYEDKSELIAFSENYW